jgi:protein tyrosine/serine phosphatase
MRHGLAVIIFSLWVFFTVNPTAYAAIDPTTIPITKFSAVTPDIFRGSRPSAQALQLLAKEGLKTVIDLEDVSSVISSESRTAKAAGLQFISKPMSGHLTPDDQEVTEILALLVDPANYPVFVHCQLGEDRSGLIVALYRVTEQKWTAADAYNEWVQDGFHTFLTALKDYFEERTAGH